jgi:hypothetical protein
MRRLFSISIITALCFFAVTSANAQKSKAFAGTVKFSTKYEGELDPQKHVPGEQVYTIYGNKIKVNSPQSVVILNGDAITVTFLLDVPGYRMGYTQTKEEIKEEMAARKYTYVKGTETKVICGYTCTRYDITIYDIEEDEEYKKIVYTTTEIGADTNINAFGHPGLTGFPLYEESEHKGVKTIEEAIEVKKGKIKDVDFLVPGDYKMYTLEEFMEKIRELTGGAEEE